jgi:Fe2+ or Zn2+ uptake regulation protein
MMDSLNHVAGTEGFKLSSRQLEFSGVCGECR